MTPDTEQPTDPTLFRQCEDSGHPPAGRTCHCGHRAFPEQPTDARAAREHELKTWPGYFRQIESGVKTFEVRRNDRGFQVGDTLRLREWDKTSGDYTGREITRTVAYLLDGFHGLQRGHCVMALAEPRNSTVREVCEELEALARHLDSTSRPAIASGVRRSRALVQERLGGEDARPEESYCHRCGAGTRRTVDGPYCPGCDLWPRCEQTPRRLWRFDPYSGEPLTAQDNEEEK